MTGTRTETRTTKTRRPARAHRDGGWDEGTDTWRERRNGMDGQHTPGNDFRNVPGRHQDSGT